MPSTYSYERQGVELAMRSQVEGLQEIVGSQSGIWL
jgi:hypothetical protein